MTRVSELFRQVSTFKEEGQEKIVFATWYLELETLYLIYLDRSRNQGEYDRPFAHPSL